MQIDSGKLNQLPFNIRCQAIGFSGDIDKLVASIGMGFYIGTYPLIGR
jgi:hypothetical protein